MKPVDGVHGQRQREGKRWRERERENERGKRGEKKGRVKKGEERRMHRESGGGEE